MSVQTGDEDDLDFDDVFIAGSDGRHFHRKVNAPAQPEAENGAEAGG